MPLEARVRGHQFCARDLRAERRLGSPSTPASSGACSREVPALDRHLEDIRYQLRTPALAPLSARAEVSRADDLRAHTGPRLGWSYGVPLPNVGVVTTQCR